MVISKGLAHPCIGLSRQGLCDFINNDNFGSGSGVLSLLVFIGTYKTKLIPVRDKWKGWGGGCSSLIVKIPGSSTAVGDSYLFREIPFPHCSTFFMQTPIMHSLAVFAFPHHWEPSKSMQSFGGIKNKGELYFNVPLKSKTTLPGLLLFFFFSNFFFCLLVGCEEAFGAKRDFNNYLPILPPIRYPIPKAQTLHACPSSKTPREAV